MVMGDGDAPRCEFCKHWMEGPNQKETNPDGSPAVKFGKCTRYPPVMLAKPLLMPRGGPQLGADGQPHVNPYPLWPITGNIEVCGEFKAGVYGDI